MGLICWSYATRCRLQLLREAVSFRDDAVVQIVGVQAPAGLEILMRPYFSGRQNVTDSGVRYYDVPSLP